MKKLRVCLCQILCIDSDREGNFTRIENALRAARDSSADIACFPETCVLGWVNPEAHQLAHPIPGPDTERFGELARRYGMMIVAGLAEKCGNLLYDSAVAIDSNGAPLLVHRKINLLAELMTPPYTPGKDIQAVETRFGRLGILICADTFVDDYLGRMRAQKPDIVLVPYGWAAEMEAWPEHGGKLHNTVSNAARRIGVPVVGVDLVGAISNGLWRGYAYGGQSIACDSSGAVVAACQDRDVDICTVEISMPE